MPPRVHDITRPVYAGMPVWPGDAPCSLAWTDHIARGGANAAALSYSVHTGTHADGPYHVLDDGARIGDVPLEAFFGPAHVVDAAGESEIGAAWLEAHLPGGCQRLLLRTGAWADPAVFPAAWPALTVDAARLLVRRGVRLVGVDAPSPDPLDSRDLPVHRVLLGAGVAIVENLMLDGIEPAPYELVALPLRLAEADSSPVRAVLVER
ncbi:MAG TPA: cyclase family protein [Longimicrobium sp.]|nr:cyclase family protein [Longimicrobium sp.]